MDTEIRAKFVHALVEIGVDEWILANLTDKNLLVVVAGVLSKMVDNMKREDNVDILEGLDESERD